ncbi:MAG: hypothetical protein ACXWKX_07070 [Caulobacteraceae bacterium]
MKQDEQYDEAEASRRRDEVIKRMLATPPQPRTAKAPKAPKASQPDAGKGTA